MTEMLRLVITADADQAVKKIKQLGGVSDSAAKSTDDLGKSSKQTGLLMKAGLVAGATAAAYAMVRFGASSVKAAAEAEQAQMRLDDAFAKFPKLADSSADALRQLNTELQKKTRFDDDALASGQAILAQFDLTGRQIENLTPLVADYAAKMGLDIPAASTNVGKALLGNMKALKSLGIDYKLTGDKAVDFANITELMSAKVGGFAEKDGKTAAGQLAILNNQFGELQETVGKQLLPALSGVVTTMTGVVSAFGSLPGPVQQGALAIGAVSIAAGVVIPWIAKMKLAGETLGISWEKSSGKMGKLAKIAGPTALALAALPPILDQIAKVGSFGDVSVDKMTAALLRLNGQAKPTGELVKVFGDNFTDLADRIEYASQDGAWEFFAERLTSSEGYVRDSAAAFASLDSALQAMDPAQAASTFAKIAAAAQDQGASIEDLKALLPGYTGQLELAGVGAAGAADATGDLAGATDDLNGEIDDTLKRLSILNGGVLDLTQANMDFAAGQDDIAAAFKESKGELGDLTAEQRASKGALLDQATAAQGVVDAMLATGSSQAEAAAKAGEMRQAMIDSAVAAGGNREAVTKLIDEVLRIPPKAEVSITSDTRPAQKILDEWIAAQKGRRISIPIYATGARGTTGGITQAEGGYISGPGTSTSDSIPVWLSDGEYVIKAATVDKVGVDYLDKLNAGRGFADGGLVGAMPAATLPVITIPRATAPGSTTSVTVNVSGSVVSERDLVRAVRDGLVDMQRRGDTVAA